MIFGFRCRLVVESDVQIEAENEQEAWQKAMAPNAGETLVQVGRLQPMRLPSFTRKPELDEYDL